MTAIIYDVQSNVSSCKKTREWLHAWGKRM